MVTYFPTISYEIHASRVFFENFQDLFIVVVTGGIGDNWKEVDSNEAH